MKKLMVVVALAASVAMADECFCGGKKCADGVNCEYALPYGGKVQTAVHICKDGTNELLDAYDEAVKADAEREAREDYLKRLVAEVYGEGTNSSFITRKELTATQKRFVVLGNNLLVLVQYVKSLERRIAELEGRQNIRVGAITGCPTEAKEGK